MVAWALSSAHRNPAAHQPPAVARGPRLAAARRERGGQQRRRPEPGQRVEPVEGASARAGRRSSLTAWCTPSAISPLCRPGPGPDPGPPATPPRRKVADRRAPELSGGDFPPIIGGLPRGSIGRNECRGAFSIAGFPSRERVRSQTGMGFFGRLLDKRDLWQLNRRSTARAAAVGIFCSMIPVPFQMLVATAISVYIGCNVPVAVAMCWITNPLTMGPIFFGAYKVGAWILGMPAPRRAVRDLP